MEEEKTEVKEIIMDQGKKQCTKCLNIIPLDDFSKNKQNKDGLRYACKRCEKEAAAAHYKKNKAKISNQVSEWQSQNTDKAKEYKRNYYRRKKDEARFTKF